MIKTTTHACRATPVLADRKLQESFKQRDSSCPHILSVVYRQRLVLERTLPLLNFNRRGQCMYLCSPWADSILAAGGKQGGWRWAKCLCYYLWVSLFPCEEVKASVTATGAAVVALAVVPVAHIGPLIKISCLRFEFIKAAFYNVMWAS